MADDLALVAAMLKMAIVAEGRCSHATLRPVVATSVHASASANDAPTQGLAISRSLLGGCPDAGSGLNIPSRVSRRWVGALGARRLRCAALLDAMPSLDIVPNSERQTTELLVARSVSPTNEWPDRRRHFEQRSATCCRMLCVLAPPSDHRFLLTAKLCVRSGSATKPKQPGGTSSTIAQVVQHVTMDIRCTAKEPGRTLRSRTHIFYGRGLCALKSSCVALHM